MKPRISPLPDNDRHPNFLRLCASTEGALQTDQSTSALLIDLKRSGML
jgi:hypothetical protein